MAKTDPQRRAEIEQELLVEPGTAANLAGRSTSWTGDPELEERAKEIRTAGVEQLSDAQELLYASDSRALLIIFQAIDAAGKDSTIEHVMSGVNPQGVHVHPFKKPSTEELDHAFLWRVTKAAPARGQIGIFNRSHYEEVVVLRVHPEWLEEQRLPEGDRGPEFWRTRYDDINAFEQHLQRNGTTIVKFFLHVSKAEQKKRFLARLDEPNKNWKFNADDVVERRFWDQYMQAYEDAITATSTPWAPWYVIPADDKKVMQAMVVSILVDVIASLDLQWPVVTDEERAANEKARQELEAEPD
jgi:PPK2 family polyphosphate:nucleotide phosphotransferase